MPTYYQLHDYNQRIEVSEREISSQQNEEFPNKIV